MTRSTAAPLTEFSRNRYLTYPHALGFLDDGHTVVFGEFVDGRSALYRCDVATGAAELLTRIDGQTDPFLPFEISRDARMLAYMADGVLWLIDPSNPATPVALHRPADDETLTGVPSIRRDGRRAIIGTRRGDRCGFVEVDTASGAVTMRYEVDWWLNHAHYCPYDPAWIGFCHEGPCDETPDRVWALHTGSHPEGRCLFDQHWHDPERRLSVGHERWAFHDSCAYAVAYGQSMGRPRGIYEIYPDARGSRLVGEGERDWHLDVSRDGRWLAVDTTGPYDAPGRGWENAKLVSDVMIMNAKTGERKFLARSRQHKHPSHPHPVFTPDGRWILFNEASEDLTTNRVVRVENPWA